MAKSHRRKRRLNRIRRSQVNPVSRGKIVESEKVLLVLGKTFHGFGILVPERIDESSKDRSASSRVGARYWSCNTVSDLLKEVYSSATRNPELRRRVLDIIDNMPQKEIYGVVDI